MKQWINKSIFYHIYPLGFCGAPEYNDGVQSYRLDKIIDWIPHLKALNINAVYFGPVFEATKHGYDTKDYYKIDVRLGDNASFKKICDFLHANGIKVVLDGVFNHVGRDFWAFKDVQQNKQNSMYCGWFHNLNFGGSSPKGDPFWYEGWSGHYDLVKLNLQNSYVVEHLLGAVEKWIDEFDIDGLRLDAADCVDMNFFRQLKDFCSRKKPGFWLMGEIIHGDYNRWANENMLDSVTNYECYKGLYSSHNDHNYFEIAHSLQRQFSQGGIYQKLTLYSFLDNHDVDRIASQLKDKNHLKNCYTLMYCMPGVPSVYYGSEWGAEGRRTRNDDRPLRPELNLGRIENADEDLNNWIAKLGKIRSALEPLQFGSYKNDYIRNEQLVFSRSYNSHTVYIALNLSQNDSEVSFNAAGGFSRLTDALTGESFDNTGYVRIPVYGYGARILVMNNGDFSLSFDDKTEVVTNLEGEENTVSVSAKKNRKKSVKKETEPLKEVTEGKYISCEGSECDVLCICEHSKTGEKLVICKDISKNKSLAVPYDTFTSLVKKNGKTVRSFDKI